MVLHVFTSLLGGVPLCIPYGLYSGTSLGGTTREILGGYPGRVLSSAVRAKDYSGRASEPPLKVLPIYVLSPPLQSTDLPSRMPEDMGRDRFRAAGNADSLLTNAELVAGVVSSILWDFDLKKADASSVEKALTLSLRGAVFVCPNAFICLSHRCSNISANLISFLFFYFFLVDGYVYEESDEEG